jgi:hypothetical protein
MKTEETLAFKGSCNAHIDASIQKVFLTEYGQHLAILEFEEVEAIYHKMNELKTNQDCFNLKSMISDMKKTLTKNILPTQKP